MNLVTRRWGIHEWSYSNDYNPAAREDAARRSRERFKKLDIEVELGFTAEQIAREVERCLNCDMQTVFTAPTLHRVRRLHRHLSGRLPGDHAERRRGRARTRLTAPAVNPEQDAVRLRARCRRPGA